MRGFVVSVAGALALILASASTAAAATPLTGQWGIQGSRTVFHFEPCGEATCAVLESSGKIIRDPDIRDANNPNPELRGRHLKGLTTLRDLHPAGPGLWKGSVYSPGAGATYPVTVTQVDGDTLTAKGCAAPLLCQTDVLKRAK